MKTNPVKTVLTITIGFLIVYFITGKAWAIKVSAIIGISGLVSAYIAKKIDFFWMKLSWLLSLFIPNILLTIVYYFVLTPVALFSKLFGNKDHLSLKNSESSLFTDCHHEYNRESFEKTW